jgi:hypothetical protein
MKVGRQANTCSSSPKITPPFFYTLNEKQRRSIFIIWLEFEILLIMKILWKILKFYVIFENFWKTWNLNFFGVYDIGNTYKMTCDSKINCCEWKFEYIE